MGNIHEFPFISYLPGVPRWQKKTERSSYCLRDEDKVNLSVDKWVQLDPAMGLGSFTENLPFLRYVKEDKKESSTPAVFNPFLCESPICYKKKANL